ncbi:MAG: CHAT domain-containing protein [bacterium]
MASWRRSREAYERGRGEGISSWATSAAWQAERLRALAALEGALGELVGGLDAAGAGEDRPTAAALRRLLPAGEVVLAASRIGETGMPSGSRRATSTMPRGPSRCRPRGWPGCAACGASTWRGRPSGRAVGPGRGPTAVPGSQRWYRWRRCPTPPCSCLGTRRGSGADRRGPPGEPARGPGRGRDPGPAAGGGAGPGRARGALRPRDGGVTRSRPLPLRRPWCAAAGLALGCPLALADEGRLTLLDILTRPLRAALVVLSGCETGRHLVLAGEEAVSPADALLLAGVGEVVAADRVVGDAEAARFVDAFAAGGAQDPASGLRAAAEASWRAGEDTWEAFHLWSRVTRGGGKCNENNDVGGRSCSGG